MLENPEKVFIFHELEMYKAIDHFYDLSYTGYQFGEWLSARQIASAIGIKKITQVHCRLIIKVLMVIDSVSLNSRITKKHSGGLLFYMKPKDI